jgi:EAL domain-containing protein (putative c-di-GMP-specific phosphodiesterase class I)/GGDEF domain-containing protein
MVRHLPWERALDKLTFAFQPIVNAHTGACYGYEALLRGWERAGFDSIQDVFDSAYAELALHQVDLALRDKAIGAFMQLSYHQSAKLFYNVDGRVLDMPDYQPGLTRDLLRRHGLGADALCLEISERHEVSHSAPVLAVLHSYRAQSFGIALDDFGAGYSGLQLLYNSHPDYIKIDRFFIEGISRDPRKKLFVSNVVAMARLLGVSVIAEGVETADELRICRDIGCDLLQGYYIQRPTTVYTELLSFYPAVYPGADRRRDAASGGDSNLRARMSRAEPIASGASMSDALARFRETAQTTFLVAVNRRDEPTGLLREESIKRFVFSPYGWALLAARQTETVDAYISGCPVADVHTPFESVIELFSVADDGEEGVILTDNGRYAGFIAASEILRGMNEREVAAAREQNPLTRLPGNHRIAEYLREALADESANYSFVYYDFDGFKAFNDAYGFRRGDRAIQMFAQRLRLAARERPLFIGHVGGDDFFAGTRMRSDGCDRFVAEVGELMAEFRDSVRGLYSAEDLARGGVRGRGRDGETRVHPLLGISAAIVYVPANSSRMTLDELGTLIATLKVAAKNSPSHLMTLVCDGTSDPPDYAATLAESEPRTPAAVRRTVL